MNFLQIGVGGFGGTWLKTISKSQHRLAALVDVKPESLAKASAEYNVPAERCFSDLAQALAAVQIDAAVVVTPPAFHRAPVETLLERGIPVISEKPMAETMADCRAMVATHRRTGVEYTVSQNYRWAPAPMTARRLIGEGKLGTIGQMRFDFWLGAAFKGTFRETMDQPLIVDMAIHHCDLIRYVTGLDAVSASASSWNVPWSAFQKDSSACCVYAMSNGARVVYDGSWSAHGNHTNWSGDWLIEGTLGALRHSHGKLWLSEAPPQVWAKTPFEWKEIANDTPLLLGQEYVLDDFTRAVAERRPTATTCTDNLNSVGMVFAALDSLAKDGVRVPIQ